MTEVLAHLDVNTETLVPDPREAIVIGDLEVTEEMAAVVTEAVIGILPHADIPICLHQIKECEAAIGRTDTIGMIATTTIEDHLVETVVVVVAVGTGEVATKMPTVSNPS